MKAVVAVKYDFACQDIYIAIFQSSEDQYSNARSKVDKITQDNVYITEKLFFEILLEDMKPVVLGDKGG